jgi:hypothetical protein
MFVLLEHRTADGVHWDFMLEVPGREKLATWRLAETPLEVAGPIRAERIGDHRREYLEFEGDIGGGRGEVKRVDRGDAQVVKWGDLSCLAQMAGERLRGIAILERDGEHVRFSVRPAV